MIIGITNINNVIAFFTDVSSVITNHFGLANRYAITYNSNGGTGSMSTQYIYAGTEQKLTANTFKNEGHIFSGWNTKADGSGTDYTDEQLISNPTTNLTLYAKWTSSEFTITFDPNGGTTDRKLSSTNYANKNCVVSTIKADEISSTTNLYNSSIAVNGYYTGNSFSSWGTVGNNNVRSMIIPVHEGDKIYSNSFLAYPNNNNYTGNKLNAIRISFMNGTSKIISWGADNTWNEFKANNYEYITVPKGYDALNIVWWTDDTNNCVYILNPENCDKETQTVSSDSEEPLKENIYGRAGYTFVGWNTKEDGTGTSYNDKESIKKLNLESDITLYAQWKAVNSEYTITFVNYEEDADTSLPSQYQRVEYIESTGTQYIDSGYNATPNTKVSMDLSFSSNHSPANYPGTSIANTAFFGTIDNSENAFMLNWGGQANQKNQMYVWLNKSYSGGGRDNGRYISDSIRNNRNTLTISKNSLTYGTYNNSVSFTTKSTIEGTSLAIFGSHRYGTFYPFASSNMKLYELSIYENDVLVKHYLPCYNKSTGEIGLYEKIEGEFLTDGSGSGIAFNKGEDKETKTTEVTKKQTLETGVSANLDANTFTKEGYKFAGWNTAKDGTGASYADRQEVLDLPEDSRTLYAQWEIVSTTPMSVSNSDKRSINKKSSDVEINQTNADTNTKNADIDKYESNNNILSNEEKDTNEEY